MRSSEIRLRKLKLRLRDKRFANRKATWQQPLRSVLSLRGFNATDFIIIIMSRYKNCDLRHNRWRLYPKKATEMKFLAGENGRNPVKNYPDSDSYTTIPQGETKSRCRDLSGGKRASNHLCLAINNTYQYNRVHCLKKRIHVWRVTDIYCPNWPDSPGASRRREKTHLKCEAASFHKMRRKTGPNKKKKKSQRPLLYIF